MKTIIAALTFFYSLVGYSQVSVHVLQGVNIHEDCNEVGNEYIVADSMDVFILTNGEEKVLRIYVSINSSTTYTDISIQGGVNKIEEEGNTFYKIIQYGPHGHKILIELYPNSNVIYLEDNSKACSYFYYGRITIPEWMLIAESE